MDPQVRWAITKLCPYNKGHFLIIPLMEVKSYLYLKLRTLMADLYVLFGSTRLLTCDIQTPPVERQKNKAKKESEDQESNRQQ